MELKKKITVHRNILLLLVFYFVIHFINLTLLPPFNDESIYLDWAWTQLHMPGHLYDSLMDAKQPLMIWLFGIAENIFTDPLFAGRFVSVIFGSLTLLGIYKITSFLFDKKIALYAAGLYSIVPLFVFYNRQALMESAIACIGIWALYVLLKLLRNPNIDNGILLGIVFGIGFFIKSSTILFIIASIMIIFFLILVRQKTLLIKPILVAIAAFFCIDFLLFIHPLFWQTFASNNRYTYSFSEYMALPIFQWVEHLFGSLEIAFFFITPFLLIFGISGIYLMKKNKIKNYYVFITYFVIALVIEIFSARTQNQRYIVPFLPFLVIPAAYMMNNFLQGNIVKRTLVIIALLPVVVSTSLLLVNPDFYIMQMARVSTYSNVEHIRGQMSGYGIKEVMSYIKNHSQPGEPTLVLFALNTGNPENAVNIYSQRDAQLYGLHIDRSFFPDIDQYQCFSSKYPTFFVTRYDQQIGLDQFFEQRTIFKNPDQKYYLGIYSHKKNCRGKTLSLSDYYTPAMVTISEMR